MSAAMPDPRHEARNPHDSCRNAGKHDTKKKEWIHLSNRSESTAG